MWPGRGRGQGRGRRLDCARRAGLRGASWGSAGAGHDGAGLRAGVGRAEPSREDRSGEVLRNSIPCTYKLGPFLGGLRTPSKTDSSNIHIFLPNL